jgi:hypothetical protein
MARPTKQNVDYFSHDCDMRNDVKIKALRRKFKHLGYSIYIITLELLGDTEYFQMKWDEMNIELLASEYDCDTDKLNEIINYCIQLDLFQLTYGYLHCENFTKRLEETVLSRRKDYCSNNSPIMKLRLLNDNNNEVNVDNNTQSKVKESKVKESIGEDSILNKIEEEAELEEYYKEAYNRELEKEYIDTDVVLSYGVAYKLYQQLLNYELPLSEYNEIYDDVSEIGWDIFFDKLNLSDKQKSELDEVITIKLR